MLYVYLKKTKKITNADKGSAVVNPMCVYRADTETMEHFLLCCHFYSTQTRS